MFGIGDALMLYSPKFIDFARIFLDLHIVDPGSQKLLAKLWVLYTFCGLNFGFLPQSSAHFTAFGGTVCSTVRVK